MGCTITSQKQKNHVDYTTTQRGTMACTTTPKCEGGGH